PISASIGSTLRIAANPGAHVPARAVIAKVGLAEGALFDEDELLHTAFELEASVPRRDFECDLGRAGAPAGAVRRPRGRNVC
ncbi:MAG: hypothetical protein MUF54_18215, partial [Polyangiaceae bacterium]|nr:hypothetical protein [Polyangiaceae bacterium]